jgi:hypothetical protein
MARTPALAGRVADGLCGESVRLSPASAVVRTIAPLGVYDWYMRRQRHVHTVVTNLHGPARPMTFCGATITDIVPLAVGGGGNVTVTFAALSYAGTLVINVTADPDAMPDLIDTAGALQAELDTLTAVESSLSDAATAGRGAAFQDPRQPLG